MANSGYRPCTCRDCFETAIGNYDDAVCLCNECEDAGCDGEGNSECCCEPDLEELDLDKLWGHEDEQDEHESLPNREY
jgi:hypothetical protein